MSKIYILFDSKDIGKLEIKEVDNKETVHPSLFRAPAYDTSIRFFTKKEDCEECYEALSNHIDPEIIDREDKTYVVINHPEANDFGVEILDNGKEYWADILRYRCLDTSITLFSNKKDFGDCVAELLRKTSVGRRKI